MKIPIEIWGENSRHIDLSAWSRAQRLNPRTAMFQDNVPMRSARAICWHIFQCWPYKYVRFRIGSELHLTLLPAIASDRAPHNRLELWNGNKNILMFCEARRFIQMAGAHPNVAVLECKGTGQLKFPHTNSRRCFLLLIYSTIVITLKVAWLMDTRPGYDAHILSERSAESEIERD